MSSFGRLLGTSGQDADHGHSHLVPAVCVTGQITHTLKAEGFDASEDGTWRGQQIVAFSCKDHGGDAGPISPTLRSMGHDGSHANAGGQVAVMAEYYTHDYCHDRIYSTEGISPALNCSQFHQVRTAMQVRRLTPRECERLQGFQFRVTPDYPGAWEDGPGEWWSPDYTLIPGKARKISPEKLDRDYVRYLASGGRMSFAECCQAAADGPRYKALGNSMAVPVMAWIGRRIAGVLT